MRGKLNLGTVCLAPKPISMKGLARCGESSGRCGLKRWGFERDFILLPHHQCLETISYAAGAWHLMLYGTFPMSDTCTYTSKGQNRNAEISGWKLFIGKIFRKAPISMCKMLVMVHCSVLGSLITAHTLRCAGHAAGWLVETRPPRLTPFSVVALRIPVGRCFVLACTDQSPGAAFPVNVFGMPVLTVFAHAAPMFYFCSFVGWPTRAAVVHLCRVRALPLLCSLLLLCVPLPGFSSSFITEGWVQQLQLRLRARGFARLCSPRSPPPPLLRTHPRCRLACFAGAAHSVRGSGASAGPQLSPPASGFPCYRPFKPPPLLPPPARRSPPSAGRAAGCLAPAARGARRRRRASRAVPRGRQRPGPPR